jgi:hypothetical protein
MKFFSLRPFMEIFGPTGLLFALHRLRIWLFPFEGWTDPFLHFLGGVSIAWLTWRGYLFLKARAALPGLPRWALFLACVSVTALVGVLWEFYEYAVFIWLDPTYDIRLPDTMSDLLLDLSGGALLAGIALVRSRSRR